MHATHKSELRPLPMRISQLQFERLQAARARDGLSVQEHVRRGLDHYLEKIEKQASKIPSDGVKGAPVEVGVDSRSPLAGEVAAGSPGESSAPAATTPGPAEIVRSLPASGAAPQSRAKSRARPKLMRR